MGIFRRLAALAAAGLVGVLAAGSAQAQSGLFYFEPYSNGVTSYTTNAGATPTLLQTFSSGASVNGFQAVVRGDQAFAYVDYGVSAPTQTIQVINTATQAIVQTVTLPSGNNPLFMVFSPSGSTLYVANGTANNVLVYSVGTTTGLLTQTSTIGLGSGSQPRGIGISPDGTTLYVANLTASTLSVINTATNAVTATVALAAGAQPAALAMNSAGTFIYLANIGNNTVSVVSTSTNAVVSTISVGAGSVTLGLAVSSSGRYLYVGDQGHNLIKVYDTAAGNALVGSSSTGTSPTGLALSPDGSMLYVADAGSNTSQVFSINTANGLLTPIGFFTGNHGLQPGLCGTNSSANGMLASGATFFATSNGALGCAGSSATMSGGTILVGVNGLTMSTPIVLASQGGTVDTNGLNLTLGGVISGTGSLIKTGLGTLTVTGNSTYSGATFVNMGTLQAGTVNAFSPNSAYNVASGATLALAGFNQTIGSLTGAGAVTLGSATLTTGNDNTSTTFSGTISGTGGLTKTGTGTLTLSGTNTYTGPTMVNAGSLVVNGSLPGSVTVTGGTLGGNGTFGSLTAGVGSVLAPGNSIGTFTVNGNFAQTGGVYQVEVSPQGQSDQIVASGTASISGGSVQVVAQAGTYARNSTYTILTAAGGVNGAYAGVSSNFAFLMPSLSYTANSVLLSLFQSQSAFAAGAQTANQYAVGAALDRANPSVTSGDFNTVLNALSVLSTSPGAWALNQISGQPYADLGSLNVASNALFMNTLGQQMAVARGGAGSGQRVALAQACEIEACDGTSPLSVWGSMVGGLGSMQGNGSSQTFTYNVGGAAAGIDYRIDPRFLVGLGTSYTAGTQWVDSFMGKGWSNNVGIAAYGSFTDANVYVDGLAGYAYSNNQMQRYIVIPGLQPRQANGSTGANAFLGQVEAGYRIGVYAPAQVTVTPFGRFQASSINQAGFTEWGANSLNLTVAQQMTTSLRTTVGADLAGTIGPMLLGLRLGWLHEYADTSRPMTAAFAGAPAAGFTVYGATPQRDSAVIGFQASARVADSTSIYLRYDGEIASGSDNHTLNLGLRLSW